LLSGCTSYTNVNTPQIKAFQKQIKIEHTNVKSLNVKYSSHSVELTFTTKKPMPKDEILVIFSKTKEMILTSSFQKDIIEERYFKRYYKEERIYPQLAIYFLSTGETRYTGMFYSSYYKTSDVSSEAARSLVDGYQSWADLLDQGKPSFSPTP
jgi:hypothetical protein